VNEDSSVDEEVFRAGLGTGLGAVDGFDVFGLTDSSSEALSHASSSPHSAIERDKKCV